MCYKAIEGGFTNGDENCAIVSSGSTRNVTLTGLEEYVVYNIAVGAITRVGEGPSNGWISVRTAENCEYYEIIFSCRYHNIFS